MNSNFSFLQEEWSSLHSKMTKAEERVNTEPVSSASYCRLAMEEAIHKLYDLEYIDKPYNTDLVSLMTEEEIKQLIPFQLNNGLHIVRKTGNNAAHFGQRVAGRDALIAVKYLFDFFRWFARTYSDNIPETSVSFNMDFVPKIGSGGRKAKELQLEREKEQEKLMAQVAQLLKEKEALLEKAQETEQSLEEYKASEEAAKVALKAQKEQRVVPITSEFTEAETRQHLIDVDLKEAGWDKLVEGRELEHPVKGMPITSDNPKGNGFVDYVLWGEDGKPLALVEAKRASKDIEIGKHQAFLYANCLEEMYGQRPVIFYTNGYETKLWDDTFYSTPRRVYGFYTQDELQWLVQQRQTRKDIRKASVNEDIAGRFYQIEAIQRVAESFSVDGDKGLRGNKREALLVMATGSGKTRTSAALVDVLMKNNWTKRVLFLADRNALVRQAQRNFGDHLPDLSSIDLTEEKENDTTRLVFSTYPSMMNRIDNVRNSDERFYGVGHFDLIIVDEAHRSVYNRYKSIFDYFDAMVVGLTATPKDSIDHNTFELFGCSNEDPTFAYELKEATPTYLCDYTNKDVSTDFIRDGIKYSELSDEDKKKYETAFADPKTGLFPDEIGSKEINKSLFNKDTVDKVLDALMNEGIKIEGGDKIGRTIIFAANQNHAEFIVECFTKRYPQAPSGFIAMVHNQVSHAQSLIDSFCDPDEERLPQIAVSVDMMDTGIDAPRVLNLVFFKIVRSYAKFWQMIGRGTRLCPDVFGPNQPKTEFKIFDVCLNFDFFEVNKKGLDTVQSKPITQQIFECRLQLSTLLKDTGEADDLELAVALLENLHNAIAKLDKRRFQVDMNLRYVEEFEKRERWNNIDSDDFHVIEEHLSALPVPEAINEVARRFDLMMLKLQIANLLMDSKERGYQSNLVAIGEQLSKKYTIPAVAKSKVTIESIKDIDFFKKITQRRLEEIRVEIRELVQYLDSKKREPIYTDIEDSPVIVADGATLNDYGNASIYKKRVESYIRENKTNLTINKLTSNLPITKEELVALENILFDGSERGSKEDFIVAYGEQPLGVFIRKIIGLSEEAAKEVFSKFIQSGNLRADQITFVNKIISYLTKNGTIERAMLFESPFTDTHDQGLTGVFEDDNAFKILSLVDRVNDNANVG